MKRYFRIKLKLGNHPSKFDSESMVEENEHANRRTERPTVMWFRDVFCKYLYAHIKVEMNYFKELINFLKFQSTITCYVPNLMPFFIFNHKKSLDLTNA